MTQSGVRPIILREILQNFKGFILDFSGLDLTAFNYGEVQGRSARKCEDE